MAELTVPQVDFSILGSLPQVYRDARTQSIRRQTLADLGQGNVDYNTAASNLLKAGDLEGGLSLAKLGVAQQSNNASSNGIFGTPIYGTDANGKTVLGAIGKNGKFVPIDTGGVTVNPGIRTIDTGTGTIVIDARTGMPIRGSAPSQAQTISAAGAPAPTGQGGYYPKDVAGKARDEKYGAEQGEAKGRLSSLSSKLPGLTKVVNDLTALADKSTYTKVGQGLDIVRKEMGLSPRDAAVARTRYIAMVDNQVLPMLRDTFGAAFTVKEGESLRATLGDPNKTPEEKKAVLESFIQQKVRDVQALEAQTGQSQPVGGTQQQPIAVRSPDEARRLPSGTPIRLPDGSIGRVP